MIPPFDEFGHLPRGIHRCDSQELVLRFGTGSPDREVETAELLEFIDWARASGVVRMIVNGSYVTSKVQPNDVDVVILPGPDYPRGEGPVLEVESKWPFLQIFVAVDDVDLEAWSLQDFGTDRELREKGVVEVSL